MNSRHTIITIDGPAGAGKTTLARALAEQLNMAYLDTGAMYRAAAWMLGPAALQLQENELGARLNSMRFRLEGPGKNSRLLLDDKMIGDQVRTEETGLLASTLARLAVVRTFMKKAQQQMGRETSLVAEGRDMGSVVFPEADYKFYLLADPVIRADRRYRQLKEMGCEMDTRHILEQMRLRDEQDQNRTIAPLRPANDAVHIDTGGLTPEQVLKKMTAIISLQRLTP